MRDKAGNNGTVSKHVFKSKNDTTFRNIEGQNCEGERLSEKVYKNFDINSNHLTVGCVTYIPKRKLSQV